MTAFYSPIAMRRFFLLLLLAPAALPAQAQDAPEASVVVEDMPKLVGGLEGLAQEIVYPEAAKAEGAEGTVFVQFVVSEEGNVTDAEVVRGVGAALDAEALRVVRQARFEPGMQRGEPVKVKFALPIKFVLPAEKVEDR